jgi:hypothetical protein
MKIIFLLSELNDCPGCPKYKMAARKMLFRDSGLCGMASDSVEGVRSAIDVKIEVDLCFPEF